MENFEEKKDSNSVVKFIIPVGGVTKSRIEKSISQLIADYKDKVTFDEDSGIVLVNGLPHSYNEEYWSPNIFNKSNDDANIIEESI